MCVSVSKFMHECVIVGALLSVYVCRCVKLCLSCVYVGVSKCMHECVIVGALVSVYVCGVCMCVCVFVLVCAYVCVGVTESQARQLETVELCL